MNIISVAKIQGAVACVFLMISTASQARDLTMCIDPRFSKQGELKVFSHMMYTATQMAGHSLNLVPMNWEECQETVRGGKYDGAIPASYNTDRAEYMVFPSDAGKNPDSKWAVGRLNYVIITPAAINYQYNGDPKTIPQPVLIPEGYSVINDLRKIAPSLNIKEIGTDDKTNLVRLLNGSEKGSVVMMDSYADTLLARSLFKGKLKPSKAVFSKTYYMPFSRSAAIPQADIQKIWDKIAQLKNDAKWMRDNSIVDDKD
jgi:hypothetical protein